jgi:formylglycine-generating enzyme required for sulfatase activity
VPLPNPLPDNPNRWDGWKEYNSPNYYSRLGLSFDSNASDDQIEDHCRQLLVWWQKKLPLKNQPSNPLAQLLRAGLDEAPIYLVEARTVLLDPEARQLHDSELRAQVVTAAIVEFRKLISFSVTNKKLTPEAEVRLIEAGLLGGLTREEAQEALDQELGQLGAERAAAESAPVPATVPAAATVLQSAGTQSSDPATEFRRMLRLSKLCLDGDDMTDDQRDALCNMGESLGLTGGEAEDIIDEYLEEASNLPMQAPVTVATVARAVAAPRPAASVASVAAAAMAKPAAKPAAASVAMSRAPAINTSPAARALERQKFANYKNTVGAEMFLVTSGAFAMGSKARDAQPNEQPITNTTISCFYMSRFQITNAEYEKFDPLHASKRAPWADANHPSVYVSALDAEKFCEWLSRMEGRRYRLPTEAEWEYAARGLDSRRYPWGEELDEGCYANFADVRTTFPWRDNQIDDGFAESAPVGRYPRGASPFGIEDLAGNVFEWCADGFDSYKGKDVSNPRGPKTGARRNYRGGSWKSRPGSLRTTARSFNAPDYSSNDVGFRIICEVA